MQIVDLRRGACGTPPRRTAPIFAFGTRYSFTGLATTTPAPALSRRTAAARAASATPPATLAKTTATSRLAATTPPASLARAIAHLATATSTPAASLARAIVRALPAATAPAVTASRLTTTARGTSSTPAALVRADKAHPLDLLAATVPAPLALRQTGASRLATTLPPAALVRAIARSLDASTTPAAPLRRAIVRALAASTSPLAQLLARYVPIANAKPGRTLLLPPDIRALLLQPDIRAILLPPDEALMPAIPPLAWSPAAGADSDFYWLLLSDWLPEGDAVISPTVTVLPAFAGDPTPLEVVGVPVVVTGAAQVIVPPGVPYLDPGPRIQCQLAGGTTGYTYTTVVSWQDSQGRTINRQVQLPIQW